VRLEGLGQLKNPMISGIELSTFRLVAQSLNQSALLNLNLYVIILIGIFFIIFEVLTAVKFHIMVPSVMTPYGLVGGYQRFGGSSSTSIL
jgi:hypothetical protein